MSGVKRFQDLVAWKLCAELATVIFEMTENGAVTKDFGFRAQIRGELAEVQSHLIVGGMRRYFSPSDLQRAQTLADRAMGTTTNLLKSKLRQVAPKCRGAKVPGVPKARG